MSIKVVLGEEFFVRQEGGHIFLMIISLGDKRRRNPGNSTQGCSDSWGRDNASRSGS